MKDLNLKVLISILLLIAVISAIFLYFFYKQNLSDLNPTKASNRGEVEETPPTEEGNPSLTKSYKYESANIYPSFTFEFPVDMEAMYSDRGGTWDITLTKGEHEILIDLSGQGRKNFEESLEDWINSWGQYSYKFDYTIVSQGEVNDETFPRSYKLYEVTVEGKKYLYLLVNAASVNNGKGYLAIRSNSLEDEDLLLKMLNSIK